MKPLINTLKQSFISKLYFHLYQQAYNQGFKNGFEKGNTATLLREEEAVTAALKNIKKAKR